MTKEFDVDAIAAQLTLTEAATLLHGKDFWRLNGVPRLGVPSGLKVSDGPNGVRGETYVGGVTSALFPAGVCLASTFDTSAAYQVGQALAKECKTKSTKVLLGPTANIHRSPLGGRNFESYSEDPLLAGKMAAQYVRGVQNSGITAVIKHFICNDSETDRRTVDIEVEERPLREIYLRPFQIAFKEAAPQGIMSSYNKLNGRYTGEDKRLLIDILRNEWKIKDLVVFSDWWAVYSLKEAVLAGLDLEMPNSFFRGQDKLLDAASKNEELADAVYARAKNVLQLIKVSGGYDLPAEVPEYTEDLPETRQLIRQVAADGAVLLKNKDNVLPLSTSTALAAVGTFAQRVLAHGGGSASLNAHRKITPVQGLEAAFDSVEFVPGIATYLQLPYPDAEVGFARDGRSGCDIDFFNPDGNLIESRYLSVPYLTALDDISPKLVPGWTAKMHIELRPKTSGHHTLWVSSPSLAVISVDGQTMCATESNPPKREEFLHNAGHRVSARSTYPFEAGKPYHIEIHYESTEDILFATAAKLTGVRFGYLEYVDEKKVIANAVARAEVIGTAVVCVGHGSDVESEGYDRPDMNLLDPQNQLIQALADSSAKIIVANYTGSPINMPWLDQVDAVIQCWFPGQELGHSLADILSGKINPSGRLPVTFPRTVEDTPCHANFPGENEVIRYEEGLFIGYRHYATHNIPTLFPFGFGLSYTTFQVSELSINGDVSFGAGKSLILSANVKNIGSQSGRHTVLFFIEAPKLDGRPLFTLEGFAKTKFLAPGETEIVSSTIECDAFSGWEGGEDGHWIVRTGLYQVQVRQDASSEPVAVAEINIQNGWTWSGLRA